MKKIKVIAIMASLTALCYLMGGIGAFLSGGMMYSPMFCDPVLGKLPLGLFITGSIYTLIGLLTVIATFGLFRYRNWARSYWLWLTIVIFVFAIIDFVRTLWVRFYVLSDLPDPLFALSDLLWPIFALGIAIISWLFLSKSDVKELFR